MPDMLVSLYDIPDDRQATNDMEAIGVSIRRAMAPDRLEIVEWVLAHSGKSAAGECETCFSRQPVSCFIATRGSDIIGYACYEATSRNFFGPTRVLEAERGRGVGRALLLRSLRAMRDMGYAYAIIGGVGPASFYEKCVGATIIPGSTPGIYRDFLKRLRETAAAAKALE